MNNPPLNNITNEDCHCGCHKSDPKSPPKRNLVVCIDGTSNKFSSDLKLSNVIKLYRLAEKSERQLTYYNSGIGTYARPGTWSPRNITLPVYHKIDQAFALHLESIVNDAYRWISDNYQEGDRIFLFGFSRGAYQVRLLSAMIARVGLIHRGNTKQIPFAYELYTTLKDTLLEKMSDGMTGIKSVFMREDLPEAEKRSQDERSKTGPGSTDNVPILTSTSDKNALPDGKRRNDKPLEEEEAEHVFKHAFCRKVNVHFVGAWDTVSSIGFARGESHPDTTSGMGHVCHFRHALALDERRVKFLPEYVCGGASQTSRTGCNHGNPHTKEVWFPGTHSDVGGLTNKNNKQFSPPLAWMFMEASSMGLYLDANYQNEYEFSRACTLTESLTPVWWPLEYLPLSRLSYGNTKEAKTKTMHWPHVGHGRQIVRGQFIHESVSNQKPDYTPRALLYDGVMQWTSWASFKNNSGAPIEPWGAIGKVHDFHVADNNTRSALLRGLREHAGSEAGKHGLWQAGLFHALKTLFGGYGDLQADDLDAVHDIFDEVYDGRIPEKLRYEDVQPLLSHILSDRHHRSFRAAHKFITDFTDFAPVIIGVFHKGHHKSRVVFASFWGNDPDRIIAASEDGRIRVWNVQSQTKAFGLVQHESIRSFACSSNGKRAVSVSHDGTVYLWSLDQRKLLWESRIPRGSAGPVKFTAEDELIVSAIDNHRLLVWRMKLADREPHEDLEHQFKQRNPLEHPLSMEKEHLLDVGHLHLLSTGTTQPWSAFSIAEIQGVATFNDKFLALSTKSGIEIYAGEHGETSSHPMNTLLTGSNIMTLAFSPDGEHLIAGGEDKQIRIWDTYQWHEKIVLSEHDSHVKALSVSGDSKRIVSCAGDGIVHVWDAEVLLKGSHLYRPKGTANQVTETNPFDGTRGIPQR